MNQLPDESLIEVQMKCLHCGKRVKELLVCDECADKEFARLESIEFLRDELGNCGIFEDDIEEILNRPKLITH